jgi:hypothetical protein
MVAPKCTCGYSHCHRNDCTCTWQPFFDTLITGNLQKLRQTTTVESHFPNYILLRVVRLTIETNTLTGVYPLINCSTTFVHLIPFEASVAIASFVLYVAFPVGWIWTVPMSHLMCSNVFSGWHILRVYVGSLIYYVLVLADMRKLEPESSGNCDWVTWSVDQCWRAI